jgi:hypothetical protein
MPSGRPPPFLIALAALAALAALTQARAAPLDAETCAKLQGEQERLENAGVEKDMAKGPAWAKANLAPEKLNLVQRFIEIEEQLLFRCRNKAIVNLPPETEAPATGDQAEQDKDDDDKDAATRANSRAAKTAAPKPKVQTPKKASAAPAARPAKKVEAGGRKPPSKAAARPELSSEPGVTAVEKRPARAKVDDAYKPPPPDPNVNPFADQLKLPAKAAD